MRDPIFSFATPTFHGDPGLKAFVIARAEKHRQLDMLRQGSFEEVNGKACSIGCVARDVTGMAEGAFGAIADRYGVPRGFLRMHERVFEAFEEFTDAADWHVESWCAIPVGVDLGPTARLILGDFVAVARPYTRAGWAAEGAMQVVAGALGDASATRDRFSFAMNKAREVGIDASTEAERHDRRRQHTKAARALTDVRAAALAKYSALYGVNMSPLHLAAAAKLATELVGARAVADIITARLREAGERKRKHADVAAHYIAADKAAREGRASEAVGDAPTLLEGAG